jgi:hydrogenase maturation protein HypF
MTVHGVVQGVGFRPFVYGLAARLGLGGAVWNSSRGVVIDVEGAPSAINRFTHALTEEAPSLAIVEQIDDETLPPKGHIGFTIRSSEATDNENVFISPDVATCHECLRELYDPRDRRYRYPFLNCTDCGPRFTIITGIPYDRKQTTMSDFSLCPTCRAEYDEAHDRRFHAEPIACPSCGPTLHVLDSTGGEVRVKDPLSFASTALRNGKILAIKGLGGYHLACDALDNAAVAELRRRKHREAKPLAIMVADIETVHRYCHVSPLECDLLNSPKRPIVLLRKRAEPRVADAVAAHNLYLGVMLPYTPLHSLLLRDVAGPLVMTSGNRTDEPIVYRDEEALARLSGIADYFLVHNRPIHMRCDDSVTRVALGRELPLRRSRGYAPLPIRLAKPVGMPLLACGGQMKNVFGLARDHYAFLSHHIGDLDDQRTDQSFVDGIEHYKTLFDIHPEAVAHDCHPDYRSTHYALSLGLPHVAVQHHHAHLAACMAENGCEGPVMGVAFDGTGYGTDGTIWGGEFLLAEYGRFERLAHLEYIPLPGGEQAIRQPWRIAAAWLYRHFGDAMEDLDLLFVRRLDRRAWPVVRQMLTKRLNAPLTSSAGRLFDAVAALLGLRDEVQYEAQAAIELEMLTEEGGKETYPFRIDGHPMIVHTSSIIQGVVEDLVAGKSIASIATKFQTTLAEIILETCRQIRTLAGVKEVALSGGVFQNMRLFTDTVERLSADGFLVHTHRRVPPNDGGLALGQAVVANAVLMGR